MLFAIYTYIYIYIHTHTHMYQIYIYIAIALSPAGRNCLLNDIWYFKMFLKVFLKIFNQDVCNFHDIKYTVLKFTIQWFVVYSPGTSVAVRRLRLHLPMQGVWVWSLVRDLRPLMLLLFISKSCPTLCDLMDCSTLGSSVLHYLPEFARIHVC